MTDRFKTDRFKTHARSLTAPPEHGAAIVPDDATGSGHAPRAIHVGGAGALTVRRLGGGVVTFAVLPAGTLLPVRATEVRATGTTATALVGLW